METSIINGLTYKVGLHGKYYYLASDGAWLRASEQNKIKQSFGLLPIQDKEISLAAKARLMIIDVMQDSKPRTCREFADALSLHKIFTKHRILELVKSGHVKCAGMARCSIINRIVPAYKLT